MSKYCKICGTVNNDNEQVCFNCGQILEENFQNINNGAVHCSHCGTPNNPEAQYCYNCGEMLNVNGYDSNNLYQPPIYNDFDYQTTTIQKKNPWLIFSYVLIGILAFAVILLGVYLFFFKDNKGPVTPSSQTLSSDISNSSTENNNTSSSGENIGYDLEGNTPHNSYADSNNSSYSSGGNYRNNSYTTVAGTGYTISSWIPTSFMEQNFEPMASSYLPDFENISYEVTNIYDNNPSTAWVEGVSGNGVGEEITFHYHGEGTGGTPLTINSIDFITGYGKSTKSFTDNTTPIQLEISVDRYNPQTVNLQYTTSPQRVELSKPIDLKVGETVFVKITKVRKGSTDKVDDACISEIKFNVA